MKIGILTYHRSYNFGAQLQAIALRLKLVEMGHNVSFVDYWPLYHYDMYALFPPLTIKNELKKHHLGYIKFLVLYFPRRFKKMRVMWKFMKKYSCPYWDKYNGKTNYDVVIYGSDQIWRKQWGLGDKFNPVYFGENVLSTKRHIAYAASMGNLDLSPEDESFLKSSLSKFDKISVRESSLSDVLTRLGLKSQVVLDPTLLLESEEWDKILKPKRIVSDKYVLFYEIAGKSFDRDSIKDFAKRHGYRYVEVKSGVSNKIGKKDIYDAVGPEVFVSLIKHAEMVFTSSYHGLVFSILYNKKFYASYSTNVLRAKSLLEDLDLEYCLLEPLCPLPDSLPEIDYEEVNIKMKQIRKASIDFLKNIK